MAEHHHDPRLHHGPPSPSSQRDAAFSDIFGTAPSGRAQTMTSQSSYVPSNGRSQTMTSAHGQYAGMPPANPQQRQYPPRQKGYQPAPVNGHPVQHQNRIASQPQYLPSPTHPERRPYPQPTRVQPPSSALPGSNMSKPAPSRYYPAPPAMNSDPYRSRSLATPTPTSGAQFNQSYSRPGAAPPGGQMSRTTAHGRIVPERHDERTMSLTSYPPERDHTQTMSGRVIPHRRKDSYESPYQQPSTQQRFNTIQGPPRDYNFAAKQRTPSSASTSSSLTAVPSVAPSVVSDITLNHKPSVAKSPSSSSATSAAQSIATASKRAPLVYPAMLSRVADVFKERINVGDRLKNELTYKNGFTGAEGVDLIAYIIKTSDRNLALLLGRALDAQKFFHDVTYEHRLRDSPAEVYQFKDGLLDGAHDVNGVFTLLTECYSPTCTPNQLCYSIACPRRLEQQARLNMKPQPGLKRQESRSSLHGDDDKEQKLWIHSVSKEIAEGVSDKEKKRQEVICEVIYTERDFVKDLEYLRDFWMKPLRSTNPQSPSPIPEYRREKFIRTVFGNVLEVHAVNSRLAEALTRRQQQSPVVNNIGDIFLEYVPLFEPFIKYGSNQLYGKFEFEKEKSGNPAFARFVEETERMKESRKLELNGYLTKPTTRLARYPLLLEAVSKPTTDDNQDKQDLPKAVELVREFLTRVNTESGKAENHFNLMQLNQQLIFRPGEHVDLKLTEEGRQLIFKGSLKKSDGGGDIQAFLFDHALLLVRIKVVNKRDQYKVYRKPIPLELLVITQMDEVLPKAGAIKRPSSSLIPGAKTNPLKGAPATDFNAKEKGYPITFQHLGKRGYIVPLFAGSVVSRRKWIEHIEAQQSVLRERSSIFTRTILCEGFFNGANRVNCLVPIDGGRKLVYGTDTGIFVSDRRPKDVQVATPKKVIEVNKVDQIDVLEEFAMLLLLSEKTLMQVPIEGLDPNDMTLANKRPKKIMGHTNFFKAGVCLGRVLVCSVKSSTLSSTVKVLEPQDTLSKGKKQPAFRKLLQGGQEALKPFKEFYIPTESSSIHFLKSKLCVGCAKGFEVVSLETLETQSLLDPADTSLDFIQRKENVKPIAIYRLNGEFLLNYSDFSFFVNRNGWRARPDWQIAWEGQPTSFALSYPYILAFEPSFIEIRNVESGGLVHIVTGKNIRMLHESTREILYAYEDESTGDDVIASLDFWSKTG
ncbi:CNH domain-containing protein [Geopyxis carbonaria]|nr:CNH domain-containing protein [Geopyxis carbonaria]